MSIPLVLDKEMKRLRVYFSLRILEQRSLLAIDFANEGPSVNERGFL